jgi:hypothetical protein
MSRELLQRRLLRVRRARLWRLMKCRPEIIMYMGESSRVAFDTIVTPLLTGTTTTQPPPYKTLSAAVDALVVYLETRVVARNASEALLLAQGRVDQVLHNRR